MANVVYRKIVSVGEMESDEGGTFKPVKLDCGHVAKCNWIYQYPIGERMRCWHCENEKEVR